MKRIPQHIMDDLLESKRLVTTAYKKLKDIKEISNINHLCHLGIENCNQYLARLSICKKSLDNIINDKVVKERI